MSKDKVAKIRKLPASLEEAIEELESDHSFLTVGGVFKRDVVETWIEHKKSKEIDAIRLRPHPWEYHLYHDV